MVKYETFNLWYMGSNPIGLKFNVLNVDNYIRKKYNIIIWIF